MNVKDYIIICLLVLLSIVGFSLYNDRGRTDANGADIRQFKQSQLAIAEQLNTIELGLADTKKSVERIESRLDASISITDTIAERNSDSAERIQDSNELIAEGRGILQKIRERK